MTSYGQYDIAGNVVITIDAKGNATTLNYDDKFGTPNGEAGSNTPPTNPNWLNGQNTFAFPTSVTNALGHVARTQFDYFLGRPVDAEDPNGVKSSLYYEDSLDRPTKAIRAVGIASLVNQSVITYNDGAKTITTASDKDANGDGVFQSQAKYDGLGRTWRAASLHGNGQWSVVETEFDALGRAWRTSNPYFAANLNGGINPSGVWTTATFDALSRVIQVTTPDSANVMTVYSGNQVTVTDQAGKNRRSETDALGRLVKVWENPTGLNYLTSYSYDALDNLKMVMQDAQTRTFNYDSLNRLTSAMNPESGTVSYTYDANGNLLTKLDARNITTTFTYDALNRPKTKMYVNDGGITPAVSYLYDSDAFPTGAPSPFNRGSSTGRLVAVNYGGGSQGDYFGYDELGRVVRKTQRLGSINFPMTASYNRAGAMLNESYPSGRTVTMAYDNAGRLSNLAGTLGDSTFRNYATGLSYTAAGQLTKETFGTTPTPLYHRMTFNSRQQMDNIRLGTGAVDNFGATDNWNRGELRMYYNSDSMPASGANNNGNLYRAEHVIPMDDNIDQHANSVSYYNYDSLNRLKSVDELPIASWVNAGGGWLPQSYAQRYKYDRWGNRTIDTPGTWGIGINRKAFDVNTSNNRLTMPVGQTGMMTYDAAGNLTFDNYTNTASHNYQYDAENRLKQAMVGSTTNTYYYDADGRRVRRVTGATETWQVYGLGGELLAEYPANAAAANPQKEYGYRNGQLLVVYDATETGNKQWQWLVTDQLGTPRMIADLSGSLTGMKRHDYLPFGEELYAGMGIRSASTGYAAPDKVRQQFGTKERDNETGLDYSHARYYSSVQGRFTGADPTLQQVRSMVNPQNWNGYTYAINNPLAYVDQNGKWPRGIHDFIIRLAFPGLGIGSVQTIQYGSFRTDMPGTIFESNANQHAMRQPSQTLEQAQQGYQQYIDYMSASASAIQQMAGNVNGSGLNPISLEQFGNAIHPIMDNTSPAHAPFQLYDAPNFTGTPSIDGMLAYIWAQEMRAHAAAEAAISEAQLNSAVSAVRAQFKKVYGQELYNRAVPGLFQNATFLLIGGKPTVNAGDLGTVTIRADGSQGYQGPLTPDKPRRKGQSGSW